MSSSSLFLSSTSPPSSSSSSSAGISSLSLSSSSSSSSPSTSHTPVPAKYSDSDILIFELSVTFGILFLLFLLFLCINIHRRRQYLKLHPNSIVPKNLTHSNGHTDTMNRNKNRRISIVTIPKSSSSANGVDGHANGHVDFIGTHTLSPKEIKEMLENIRQDWMIKRISSIHNLDPNQNGMIEELRKSLEMGIGGQPLGAKQNKNNKSHEEEKKSQEGNSQNDIEKNSHSHITNNNNNKSHASSSPHSRHSVLHPPSSPSPSAKSTNHTTSHMSIPLPSSTSPSVRRPSVSSHPPVAPRSPALSPSDPLLISPMQRVSAFAKNQNHRNNDSSAEKCPLVAVRNSKKKDVDEEDDMMLSLMGSVNVEEQEELKDKLKNPLLSKNSSSSSTGINTITNGTTGGKTSSSSIPAT